MWRIVIVVVVRLRVIWGSCLRLWLFRVVAFSFVIFREYSLCDFTVINFHLNPLGHRYAILYIGSVL